MRRGLRWLLIASLGLNLLVAGVVVGEMVSGPMGRRGPSVELALGPFARALAPEDRRAIARDLLDRADLRDLRRTERQEDMTALAAALRADPFEREAVAALMQAQRDKVRTLEAEVEAALLDRLVAMTPEERAGFADRIEAEAGRGMHRGD
jgi:uncharacterized membrane protein